MKKYLAKMLRRAANELDPPATPTTFNIEYLKQYATTAANNGWDWKVTHR